MSADARTRVRPMTPADVADVLAIEVRVQPRPWTEGLLRAELAQPSRCYLVAEDDGGAVVGFGGVLVAVDEAHVTNLATAPHARRRGVARSLLRGLLDAAAARGATAATLEVRAGNDAAQALYRRAGFGPVGVRPAYYPPHGEGAPAEDAVIMWLHDLSAAGPPPVHAAPVDVPEVRT